MINGESATIAQVSRDGLYVSFTGLLERSLASLRVARLSDGSLTRFEARLPIAQPYISGRSRWMPGDKAIAFIAPDDSGVLGVYVQNFDPEKDTTATRRPLAGFNPEAPSETFDISPDGTSVVLSEIDPSNVLMLAEGVRGVSPARRPRK